MRRREGAVIMMHSNVAAFFIRYENEFSGFYRLNSEIATFTALRLMMQPIIAKQTAVTKGITANKKQAFKNLGILLIKIVDRAIIFANDNNNKALAAVFKITPSDFTYQSQAKKLIQAQGVAKALKPIIVALADYMVTNDNLIALTNAIATCKDPAFAPNASAQGKKAATVAIKKATAQMATSLAIIDSLINSVYADDSPNMVNEYRSTRRVDGRGIRHTGISATFTDAATGKLIENATITIEALDKTAISNINGLAEIIKMKTGTYHVGFAAEGYVSQILDMKVSRGRVVKVGVGMVVG